MAAAVAAALMTNWVPLVIETIVAPTGIFAPVTTMPAWRPAVLPTVTVVLALTVEPPARAWVTTAAAFGMTSSTPPRMSRIREATPRRFIVFVVELSRTSLPSWNTITLRAELPNVPAPMTLVTPR